MAGEGAGMNGRIREREGGGVCSELGEGVKRGARGVRVEM